MSEAAKLDALADVLATARDIANNKHPAVADVLRRRDFHHEAGLVAALVTAIERLDSMVAPAKIPRRGGRP